ncbi:MAG: hypothetical protein EBU46_07560 [Nitrosomonadaceae bacterium]|nr:hypothetical protein [Nitrosomonadaceae bacterium]
MANWGRAISPAAEEASFDDDFDSEPNLQRKMQGRMAPRAQTARGAAGRFVGLEEHFGAAMGGHNGLSEHFSHGANAGGVRRRTCNEIFRNIHPAPVENFRAGNSYGSRGGRNAGARLYGAAPIMYEPPNSFMYEPPTSFPDFPKSTKSPESPESPDFGHYLLEQDVVIPRSLKQAGQKPSYHWGPTALRKIM